MPKGLRGFQKGHPVFTIKGNFKKGFTPWNKGKKKLQIAWNKGLKGLKNCGSFKKGHKSFLNENSFKKISLAQKGHSNYNLDKKGCYLGRENHPKWKDGLSIDNPSAYRKKWRKENPLKWKIYCYKRKILTKDLTLKLVQRVYEDNIKKHGTLTCYLCFKSIYFGQDCLEHKIPLSRGGTNIRENLDIAHRSCNSRKYNKTEKEFRKVNKNEL